MKLIRLNLTLLFSIIFLTITYSTNPIPRNFESTVITSVEVETKKNTIVKIWSKIKGHYRSVRAYFQNVMSSRGVKFLIGWLGCAALSVISYIVGYILLFAIATEVAIIIFLVAFIAALVLAAASSVFFVLWLVDVIKMSEQTKTTDDEPAAKEEPERKRRKKSRKRN